MGGIRTNARLFLPSLPPAPPLVRCRPGKINQGLCTNMCKIPTERFFEDTLGMTMAMEPDFDTYECRLSFGLESPEMDEDETVPRGCLAGCSCKELGAVVATTCSKQ